MLVDTPSAPSDFLDPAGVTALLADVDAVLRDAGENWVRNEPGRHAILLTLALRTASAPDRAAVVADFLGSALSVLARNPHQQSALIAHFQGERASAAVRRIFGADVEARPLPAPFTATDTLEDAPLEHDFPDTGEDDAPATEQNTTSVRDRVASTLDRWRQLLRRLMNGLRTRERRAQLVRRRISEAARQVALSLPSVLGGAHAASTNVRDSAVRAASRIVKPTRRLQVSHTVRATLKRGGIFSPVYAMRSEPSQYLCLARQLSDADLEFARIKDEVDALRSQGVLIDLYPYRDDPREVSDTLSGRPQSITLGEVYQRHAECRLFIASEGRELLHPFTLMPHGWAQELIAWPRRALITPLPSADWGVVEGRIHRSMGFSLACSTERGLSHLDLLLGGAGPAVLRSSASSAMTPVFIARPEAELADDHAPSAHQQQRLLTELKAHLGPLGFRWLAACAFFPAMTAPIARYFGERVFRASTEAKQITDYFPRFCTLPWMRYGYMPYWLRQLVITALSPHEQNQARAVAASILDTHNLSAVGPDRAIATTGIGQAAMVLPVRIDDGQMTAGLEVDDFAIDLLAGGRSSDIDPLLRLTETTLAKLVAEQQSAARETEEVQRKEQAVSTAEQTPLSAAAPQSQIVKLRVFIAYSRRDAEFADRLSEALRGLGDIEVVLDRTDIPALDVWQARLVDLITQADAIIFLLSPHALASHVMQWEVELSEKLGKRLVPVQIAEVSFQAVAPSLARINFARFDDLSSLSGPEFDKRLERLHEALLTDLDWVREQTRLGMRAKEWDEAARSEHRLLRGPDVDAASAWLRSRPRTAPEPSKLLQDFIAASAREETKPRETSRREPRKFLAYISHSRADRARLRPILDAIIAAGFKIWIDSTQDMDYSHSEIEDSFESIAWGTDFTSAQEDGLRRADIVVLVLSKSALASKWVHKEASAAMEQRKAIACSIDDLSGAELPFDISALQIFKLPAADSRFGDETTRFAQAVRRACLERWTAERPTTENKSIYLVDREPAYKTVCEVALQRNAASWDASMIFLAATPRECPSEFLDAAFAKITADHHLDIKKQIVPWPALASGSKPQAELSRFFVGLEHELSVRHSNERRTIAFVTTIARDGLIKRNLPYFASMIRSFVSDLKVLRQKEKNQRFFIVLLLSLEDTKSLWSAFGRSSSRSLERRIMDELQKEIPNERYVELGPVSLYAIKHWLDASLRPSEVASRSRLLEMLQSHPAYRSEAIPMATFVSSVSSDAVLKLRLSLTAS